MTWGEIDPANPAKGLLVNMTFADLLFLSQIFSAIIK